MADETQLFKEYQEYYATRAARYANSPAYKNSYEAEKKLSDVMQNASSINDAKDKMIQLSEDCAFALMKDEYLIEKNFYDKYEEIIRAKGAANVLARIDECKTVQDLMSMVTEETNKNSEEIQEDNDNNLGDVWGMLDKYTVYTDAQVPPECQAALDRWAKDIADSIKKEKKKNVDVNMETRHLRSLRRKPEHVKEYIELYKKITGA